MSNKIAEQDTNEVDKETTEEEQTEQEDASSKKRKKKFRRRKFPITLRIFVVLILFIICLLVGLIVGYGFLGDGEPMDALNIETYQHIFDIMNKEN